MNQSNIFSFLFHLPENLPLFFSCKIAILLIKKRLWVPRAKSRGPHSRYLSFSFVVPYLGSNKQGAGAKKQQLVGKVEFVKEGCVATQRPQCCLPYAGLRDESKPPVASAKGGQG